MSAGRVEWVRVERETAFEGRVVDVYVDTIRLTVDGRTRDTRYDLVHHRGAVAVVALDDDGAVALLRQFRYPVGGEIWEIPAGTLEPEESFESCAERELEEEVGARASRWTELATFWTTPGFCDERMRVFLAEGLGEGTRAHEPDEEIEVHRVPFEEALEWAARGKIADAKTLVGLWAARDHLIRGGRVPEASAP